MNISEIETNISRFLSAMFPSWTVVIALQNQPKVSDKQISFYIENIEAEGEDQWTDATDYNGNRQLSISMEFTGAGSMQTASNFVDFLRRDETNDELLSYDLAHVYGESPTRIPLIRGAKYVERTELQWGVRTVTTYSGDAGLIENGTITGDVDGIQTDIDFQK
jgi:hypothetical protein